MFSDYCPRHGRLVLLGPGNVTRIDNTADGIHVHWRCPCGGTGVLHTGRSASLEESVLQSAK